MKCCSSLATLALLSCTADAYAHLPSHQAEDSSKKKMSEQASYIRLNAALQQVLANGEPTARYTVALSDLAAWHRANHNYSQAELLYREAIGLYEKIQGPANPDLGLMLNNLATLFVEQGKYSEAQEFLERLLTLRETIAGPEHQLTAIVLNDL